MPIRSAASKVVAGDFQGNKRRCQPDQGNAQTFSSAKSGVNYISSPSHASHARDLDDTNCRDLSSSQPTVPILKAAAGTLALISKRGEILTGRIFWTQQ